MSSSLPRSGSRKNAALVALIAIVINLLPVRPAVANPVAPQPLGPFVRVLNLPVNDITYDKVSKKIFASIPSRAGAAGNSVTEIDPVTGTFGVSTFVGSEPNKIAISNDGQTVYVGLDGSASVRRMDVASHTATVQFRLGNDSGTQTPYTASDL